MATSTPPAIPVTKGAAKKGIGAWYAGHKPEALLGAAGIVVTLALYVRSKNAAAAAAGSTASGTATGTTSTVMPGTEAPSTGSYGNGGGDLSGITTLLEDLSTQVSALTPAPATATTPASTPAAASYSALTSPADLQALTEGNTPLFYQPTPGVYEQVGQQAGNTTDPELAWIQQNLPGGTGLYVQNPNT